MQEKIFKGIFALCTLLSVFAVLVICFFLFTNTIPAITQIGLFDFVFGLDWYPTEEIFEIFLMIAGNVYITALAILVGVSFGVLSAIYLLRFTNKEEQEYILPAIELLGAILSVVYGLFGLVMIVPPPTMIFSGIPGKSVLTAALVLSIMVLPTIISVSKAAIDALPQSCYKGALVFGASRERSVFFAPTPAAGSGILASIILGVGRTIGEAIAVIVVAGNQTLVPTSILEGVRILTTNIILKMGYARDLHGEILITNAVVLFVFILPINTCFSALKREAK